MKRPWKVGWLFVVGAGLAVFACRGATFEELAQKATEARKNGRTPEAIDLYGQALQLNPKWPQGWLGLGVLFYECERYSEAQPAFERCIKLSDNAVGWAFLGLCEFETGSYTQARDHLEKALRSGVAPEIEQAGRFHHALLLTRLGSFGRAARAYRALVGAGLRNTDLIVGLGLNSLARRMLPRDIGASERDAVTAAGQTAYAWMSKDAGTGAAFESFLAAYPSTPGVHYFHAMYLLSSQPEAASQEFQRELQLFPHSAEARAFLALAQKQAGQEAGAVANAKQAVEDDPVSPTAQYAVGVTLDDAKQAAAHLEIAEFLDPGNLDGHMALAHVYSELGRNGDSRRERKISIELAGENQLREPN